MQKNMFAWSASLLILLGLLFTVYATQQPEAVVLLQWQTATELDTAGFNLYRAESADGPFVKVNAALIAAAADPVKGSLHHFEDRTVQSGRTYYYQLEDVDTEGQRTTNLFDPIAARSDRNLIFISAFLLLVMGAAVAVAGRRAR